MVALNEQRLLFNGNKLRSMAFRSGHDPQLWKLEMLALLNTDELVKRTGKKYCGEAELLGAGMQKQWPWQSCLSFKLH